MSEKRKRKKPARLESDDENSPPPKTKKKPSQPRTKEKEYDKEIVLLNQQNYRATDIAATLVRTHGLDPKIWTPKKVDDRLRYLKKFGKAELAPTNEARGLRAVDPQTTTCLS